MTLKRWVWIAAGLLVWAGIVVLWATGPYGCQPPRDDGRVVCKG